MAAAAALFLSAGVANADTVTVNGVSWTCQHTCNVNVSPGGGTTVARIVTDSVEGGWVDEEFVDHDGPVAEAGR